MHADGMLSDLNRRAFISGATTGVLGVLTLGAEFAAHAQQAAPSAQPAAAPAQGAAEVAAAAPAGRVFYGAISGETVPMRGFNGDTIDAYVAHPAGSGKHPGVVVIHHMPGWDEATIEVTRRFAQHGFTAICPNLHFRGGKATPEGNSAVMQAQGGLKDDSAMGDVEGAIRYLRASRNLNGKVGIVGYCSGGRQAYLAACTLKGIDAGVFCYPNGLGGGKAMTTASMPVDPMDLTKDLSCPLMGLFGKDDKNPSHEQVVRVEAELKRLGKTYEFHTFENAGHGFFGTERSDYRAPASEEGWKLVYRWFENYLG